MITKYLRELKSKMRYGDQGTIAEKLGISQQLVSAVLLGLREDNYGILIETEILLEERKAKRMKAKKQLSDLKRRNNKLQQQIQAR